MNPTKELNDVRLLTVKLSDENKKYVIAVAQALLFTQKKVEGGQDKADNKICSVVSE